MWTRDDLEDYLQHRVHMRLGEMCTHILDSLISVFLRIPYKDTEVIFDERDVQFIFAFGPAAFPLDFRGKKWFVILARNLVDMNKEERYYSLAHELAHVFLDGPLMHNWKAKEIAADEQIIKWGFEKEVWATEWSYMNERREEEEHYGQMEPRL